jgi:tRNA pseudouridine-54 N-methylase
MPGINFEEITICEEITRLQAQGVAVWWLDEAGSEPEELFAASGPIAFVLGDHLGMSEEFLAEFAASLPRLSLGSRSYLGSSCIQLILGLQMSTIDPK